MSTSENKQMDDLTDAFAEAAKKNAEAWKRGFDLLRDTMSIPYDLSRIVSESSSTISKGFADYVRLNIEHASNLIDLGFTMSRELLSALERSGWQTKTPSAGQPVSGQAVSEIRLSGSPGDLCRSSFILESMKSGTVLARIFHSKFVDNANNTPVTIPVNIDPAEVTVAPKDKIHITLEVGIPGNIAAGTYQSMVWIDGFPELSLRVLLDVSESTRTEESVIEKKTKQKKYGRTNVRSEK